MQEMRHPVHEHQLIHGEKWKTGGSWKCDGCGDEIPGRFYLGCTLCQSYFHETCAKLPLEIKHFFHTCSLSLRRISGIGGYTCDACFGRRYHIFAYVCERCDFDMCVQCATRALSIETCGGEREGDRILHCCHRHPLQPLSLQHMSSLSCRVCNMPCSLGGGGGGGPTWGCEPCDFHLHESCLDLLPQTVHKNPATKSTPSWVLRTSPTQTCIDCNQTIRSNLVFRGAGDQTGESLCISCCLVRGLIDESSSQVSKVISHFYHPCPHLKLIFSPSSPCNACFLSHHFSYHCNSCDFFLCFNCSQLPQLDSHEKEVYQLFQHYCHWHPLKLFTGTPDTNYICNLCERLCSGSFYSCNDQCQFYIHKSCLDTLPTNYRLLSQTLVLLNVPSFECATCNRQRLGLTFYCSYRKCKFCVKCVLWPEKIIGDDGRFSSAPHWHKLSLRETRIEDKRRACFLCKEPCIAWTWSYKCSECDMAFHKSCAELPLELEHHIHPQHCLTLTKRSSSNPFADMTCKLCLKNLSRNFSHFDWVYQCQQCNFQLDTQCATYVPSLEYDGHPHLLYVVVNMHGNINCQVCGKSCKGSSTICCAYQECDFGLHLQCGPIPRMVKHPCHIHPLLLEDYYVEDNDSDVFACHICEEERDPRLRVYCCSEGCLMISDVECVLDEVLPLLRGERGEVELRTPFPQVGCKVIDNKSFIAKTRSDSTIEGAEDEIEMIKHVFWHKKLLSSLKGQLRIDSQKDDEARGEIDVESYPFSWKALSCFSKLLRIPSIHVHKLPPFIRQYNGSITTGDDALPMILGPIYQDFFAMYNIIDDKCNLTFAEKRALIFITCCFLHQMWITDVTKDTILVWLGLIRFVQEKGKFNVGFLAENIKHVWQSHYYIQSKKVVDDKTLRLEQELEQVSVYKAELRTKMDELRIKMDEAEARHHELKVMDKEHDTYRVVGSRGPMKKVRSDALAIK